MYRWASGGIYRSASKRVYRSTSREIYRGVSKRIYRRAFRGKFRRVFRGVSRVFKGAFGEFERVSAGFREASEEVSRRISRIAFQGASKGFAELSWRYEGIFKRFGRRSRGIYRETSEKVFRKHHEKYMK